MMTERGNPSTTLQVRKHGKSVVWAATAGTTPAKLGKLESLTSLELGRVMRYANQTMSSNLGLRDLLVEGFES